MVVVMASASTSYQSFTATGGHVGPPPPLPYSFGIEQADAIKAEGGTGTTTFTFTVTRFGDASGPASIGWWSWGASSANQAPPSASPSDFGAFTYPTGVVEFAAGQTTQTLSVTILGDAIGETDEQFTVSLDGIPFGSFAPPAGTLTSAAGTILNDDASVVATWNVAPIVAVTNVGGDPQLLSVTEADSGTTALSFSITRMGNISGPASVQWAIAGDGTNPVDGADFSGGVLPGGTAQFIADQRIAVVTVYVNGDLTAEATEGYRFLLSNPSAGTGIDVGDVHDVIYDTDTSYYYGSTSNDSINTSTDPKSAVIDASQGGNDTLTGGTRDETFLLGGALTGQDKINGAGGSDRLVLDGNYSAGITLGSATVTNVEQFVFAAGNSYKITTNAATVASGATLTVDATALGSLDSANVNGAAETNGKFVFLGGAGKDVFTGGSQADVFVGGGGGDALKGNNGADVFRYLTASDSPFSIVAGQVNSQITDSITSFQAGTDKLDFSAFQFSAAGAASVVTKSTSAFSTGAVNGTGFFGTAGVAVEQASLNRVVTTRVYVDADHDGNLGSGDLMIQMTGVAKGAFKASSVVF